MKNTTLLFLYKPEEKQILLAMKKRGFGKGRWNGVGGKLQGEETIREAVLRETEEEISVRVHPANLTQVAILDFSFTHAPDWNQQVHVFFVTKWEGEPCESEEMRPKWFPTTHLPFADMWPDDIFWLPEVIAGERIRAAFVFGENDTITHQNIEFVVEGSLISTSDNEAITI